MLNELLQLGNRCYLDKNYSKAREYYDQILQQEPNNVTVLHNHGLACTQMGDYEAALSSFDYPVKLAYPESLISRGAVLRTLGHYKEAMTDFANAFIADPEHASAYSNYGNSLREFCKPHVAIPFFQVAQQLNPNEPSYRLNESIAHLMAGDLLNGWDKYDARWYYDSEVSFKPLLPGIEYNGTQSIIGKTIVVYCEQGFGDNIQFIRYIRLLLNMGASVVLHTREPLRKLFEYNLPNVTIITDFANLPAYDYHCPMLDLPKCFRTTIDTIPSTSLDVGDIDASRWSKRLGLKHKLRVGIAWSSTRASWTTRFRNIDISSLASIGSDNIELISLGHGISDEEKVMLSVHGIKDYSEHISNFYDMACLVKNLDLVVSVDTAPVHLSASMGIPTWVMLSDYGVDWRWFLNRNDSPFYPSVLLFRQENNSGWQPVLKDIKNKLDKLS
jgi:Flp pilus assembly protein TadD